MSYDYKIDHVVKVVDGDTIDVVIDLGFRVTTAQRIRLLGIDTPEKGQEGWAEAKIFVHNWLDSFVGKLRIETFKADSFGRYLGIVYSTTPVEERLNDELVANGHAVVYRR